MDKSLRVFCKYSNKFDSNDHILITSQPSNHVVIELVDANDVWLDEDGIDDLIEKLKSFKKNNAA